MTKEPDIMLDQLACTPLASSTDRPAWLADRAGGVTASEAHRIARGGIPTWRRIRAEKLAGSTFGGNRHTKRGREREAYLLATLADVLDDGRAVLASDRVLASTTNPRFLATPDGFTLDSAGTIRGGVEVKSHDTGWERTDVPPDHLDQCLWGMVVTDLDEWEYAFEIMGSDGKPDLDADPTVVTIRRADHAVRIAYLIERAQAYLAASDAGELDAETEVAPEFDELLDEWRTARAEAETATAAEKALNARVKAYALEQPDARKDGYRAVGTTAGAHLVVQNRIALDEKAWTKAEPEKFAEWDAARKAVDATAETAKALYQRVTVVHQLRFVDPKTESKTDAKDGDA